MTTTTNGRAERKSLAGQLDRLDRSWTAWPTG